MKVFLGGTVNGSTWRDQLIPHLTINYFDPRVSDWNEAAQAREIQERQTCDHCLYVITPKMTGLFSLAEVLDDSYKRPQKTIYAYLEKDEDSYFSQNDIEQLEEIGRRVELNGGIFAKSLAEVVKILDHSRPLSS